MILDFTNAYRTSKKNNMHYVFMDNKWMCAFGISNSGVPIFLSKDEVQEDVAYGKNDPWNPSNHELVKTFNSKDFRDTLKEMVKERKREVERLIGTRNDVEREVMSKYRNMRDQEHAKKVFYDYYIDWPIAIHREAILRLEKLLYTSRQVTGSNGEKDFSKLIETAKIVPIENFLEFNSAGFTHCIYHNERTPSMKYYKKNNTVHCFSCQKGGDVIDVVRQLNECDFKTAINILTN